MTLAGERIDGVNMLTATQAAARLGIHPSLVRTYLRDGRLKAAHQDPWMITERELERFERARPKRGRPPTAGIKRAERAQ